MHPRQVLCFVTSDQRCWDSAAGHEPQGRLTELLEELQSIAVVCSVHVCRLVSFLSRPALDIGYITAVAA